MILLVLGRDNDDKPNVITLSPAQITQVMH